MKTDKRVIKTDEKFRAAILDLMKKKPISKITPTDICKKAGVNRNTFYAHYKNPEELLESVESELFESVKENIENNDDMYDVITRICRVMKKHKSLCKILLGGYGESHLAKRVFAIVKEHNIQRLNNEKNELTVLEKEMLSDFTVVGAAAIIAVWVRNDMTEEPERVAQFLIRVIFNGVWSVTK